jgi:L-malate glycosyltransferase
MKVVIGIPCLLRGGTEMQTLMLSKALVNNNNEVILICYHEYLNEVVIDFESIGTAVILLKWNRNIPSNKFILGFKRILKINNPDVVHIQYLTPGLLPIIAARFAGISQLFATIHQPGTPYTFKHKLLVRLGSLLCKRFISVSLFVERSWFKDCAFYNDGKASSLIRKHGTIYNCIDVGSIEYILSKANYENLRANLGLSSQFIVGIISRLSYEKGIDLILRAFSVIACTFTSTSIIIIGDGPEKENLVNMALKLNISEKVLFLGSQSWKDAIRLNVVMDLVVIPSRFEGFGLSAIEALACGKPILTAQTGGLNEINDLCPNNYTFISENIEDLIRVLKLIISKPKSELKNPIFEESVKKYFDFPIFSKNILSLYKSIN